MKSLSENIYMDSYLIYNRKSTNDADNQKNSLEYQLNENYSYAEKNNLLISSLTIEGFCNKGVINEKHSGYKEDDSFEINTDGSIQYKIDRPKFLKLIGLLKNKKVQGVIFLCWDRASRNKQDDVLLRKLMRMGVDIRFTQADYDKGISGDLHMDIDGVFASHFSNVISSKVKSANKKLRNEGKCIYFSPIGYLDKGSDNKPFDPERAHIVKRIFELYATGEWSMSQLGKWAQEQGLTTKPVRRKRTKEEILSNMELDSIPKTSRIADHKTIEYILSNPFYIGKVRTPDGFIQGKFHQPLVDIALYNKVQRLLNARRVSVHYVDKDFFTYRGMLRCTCGRGYSPYQQKGINYYRVRCKEGCDNPDKNLEERQVHTLIKEALDKIYFTDDELQEIETKAKTELGVIADQRDKDLDDLNAQRKKVFSDLDYLMGNKLTLLRTNTMSIEDIKVEESRLSSKLEEIDTKIKAHTETAQDILKYVITFSELIKNASLYYGFALDTEKQEIVSQVFTELSFNDKKLVKYRAKDGFEALLNRAWLSGSLCWTSSEP